MNFSQNDMVGLKLISARSDLNGCSGQAGLEGRCLLASSKLTLKQSMGYENERK
jgi:hypothetical protein